MKLPKYMQSFTKATFLRIGERSRSSSAGNGGFNVRGDCAFPHCIVPVKWQDARKTGNNIE